MREEEGERSLAPACPQARGCACHLVPLACVYAAAGRLQVRITLLESQVHKLEAKLGEAKTRIADLQAENEELKAAAVSRPPAMSLVPYTV